MMIIKIAGLSEGVHKYRFDEPVDSIDLKDPFKGNIIVDVELSKLYSQMVLKAAIKVSAEFECDRCTRIFDKELSPRYQVVYLFGERPEDDEDVNVIYLLPDADKINIAHEVRDYTLITVPMKNLHSEDCKGLCPRCGKDLNEEECNCAQDEVDIRWKPLVDLKKKFENK